MKGKRKVRASTLKVGDHFRLSKKGGKCEVTGIEGSTVYFSIPSKHITGSINTELITKLYRV